MGSVEVQYWITSQCQWKPAGRMNLLDFYLCVTWVPRKLDMVSSRFCRRSAMFLTVRNRLVSGSSPEWDKKSQMLTSSIRHNLANRDSKQRQTLHCKWSPTWKVLDRELAGLGEGHVSPYSSWAGLSVRYSLAVCLGSGKTNCARDQWGDIIDSELLCI